MTAGQASTPRFGALLRQYRRAAGLTQEALAERASLSARGIQDLERGVSRAPRRDTVDLLAAALGLASEARTALLVAARPSSSHPAAAVSLSLAQTAAPAAAGLTPLVGRDREMALVERFLADAERMSAPVLLLAGEPGIGKTRLLQAAAQVAVARGWRVLVGGCHRRGGQEPYAPLLGALARHLHTLPEDQLRAELEGCAWLGRLLPEFSEVLGPAPVPIGVLPPEQERRLMFAAVARMLVQAAGPAGTLLVLDDLQWAGTDALDLVAALTDALSPPHPLSPYTREPDSVGRVRILGAYRDTEVGTADPLGLLVADLAQASLARRHVLGPLAPVDAAALLDGLLVGVPGAIGGIRAAAGRVLARAGGGPFFLVSYAQALRAGSAEADAVPWDIAQGVRQRVALLPESAQGVLGGAAVVGRRVPRALLTAVLAATGQLEGETLAGLAAAERARLLLEDGDDGYVFAHDVVREVVEENLGAARRAALHGQVAAALQATPGGASPEGLAYHYARADDGVKAASALERAGDDARGRNAHTMARDYYSEAIGRLERLGQATDTARVLRKLGEAMHDLGRTEEALNALNTALALYKREEDRVEQARTHQVMAAVLVDRYDYAAAAPHLQAALDLWPPDREDAGLTRLLLDAARAWVMAGDGRAVAVAERGATMAERLGDAGLLARGAYVLAMTRAAGGAGPSAVVALYDRAEALARIAGNADTMMRIFANRAGARHALGDLVGGQSDTKRAIALGEELDVAGPLAHAYQNLAENCRQLGAWAEGRAAARRAHELGTSHTVLHLLAWMEGAPVEAVKAIEEALDDGRGRDDVQHVCNLLAVLADWRLEQGAPTVALATAREALALLSAHTLADTAIDIYGPLAEAAVVAGAPDAADVLTTAVHLVDRQEAHLVRPQILRAMGIQHAVEGHALDAIAVLRESTAAAKEQGALPQLGRSLASLRDVATARGESTVAAAAAAELADVVARIGPEAHSLVWAGGTSSSTTP